MFLKVTKIRILLSILAYFNHIQVCYLLFITIWQCSMAHAETNVQTVWKEKVQKSGNHENKNKKYGIMLSGKQ